MPFTWEETMKISGWDSYYNINHCKPLKKTTPSWSSGISRT
jgi:hypothetical protein